MRSAVTVSLMPQAKGGPFIFWDGLADACARAETLGYDAVEVFAPAASGFDTAGLQSLLAKHKLQVSAFGTGGGWVIHKWTLTHPDAEVRKNAREFIRGLIDLAGQFNAPAIIGSMQGRWEGNVSREQAVAWLGEALEDLAGQAARHKQTLLYEPLNRYETNLFNRLGDTAAWLRALRAPNLRILADLYHMNIEEANLATALRDAGTLVGHIHFVDSNRLAVGLGHTDIPAVISALRAIGYTGYLSAEALPLPDAATAARQTIEAFRRHAV